MDMVCKLLKDTINPRREERLAAEEGLLKLRGEVGYTTILMQIIDNSSLPNAIRHSASLELKNLARNNWVEPADVLVPQQDKLQVKAHIINLMFGSPNFAKKTLAEAVCLISLRDFPKEWPGLVEDLVARAAQAMSDLEQLEGILNTMHSVFQKYRATTLSEENIDEIKHVVDRVPPCLLTVLQKVGELPAITDPATLDKALTTQRMAVEVFYDLTYLDLSPFIEDHLTEFMQAFLKIIQFKPAQGLASKISELEDTQTVVTETITLFLSKYDEDFQPFLSAFAEAMWSLLVSLSDDPMYDGLAIASMDFLTATALSIHHGVFKDETMLSNVCERIVLPSIKVRDADVQMFNEECEEFIRRDIEGSDLHTRRRSACELIQGLAKFYQPAVTKIFQQWVAKLLQQFSMNPAQEWKAKDSAIYLVTTLSTRQSNSRVAQSGVAMVGEQAVNIAEFFSNTILPDLQDGADNPSQVACHMLKADAIKFVSSFRKQLPQQSYKPCIVLLAKWLRSPSEVVVTYAASTIERLLLMKTPENHPTPNIPYVDKAALADIIEPLFNNLFHALQAVKRENAYIMQCIMQVIGSAQELVGPYILPILNPLTTVLMQVSKNPSNPTYNHYLFESVSGLIRFNPQQVPAIESAIFTLLATILQNDVVEFMPYVFQVFAQLVEVHSSNVPDQYYQLVPPILSPVLYTQKGNIPAVVRFLSAIIETAPARLVQDNLLQQVLLVFQRLVDTKTSDHEGFNIINQIILHVPLEAVKPFLPTVFQVLFTRLQKMKTIKFCKMLILFCSVYIVKHGPDSLIEVVESIQPGLFKMLLQSIWFNHVQKVSGRISRKTCVVAMVRLFVQSRWVMQQPELWVKVAQHIINILNGMQEKDAEGSLFEPANFDISSLGNKYEDDGGYTTSFCPLTNAAKDEKDVCAEIVDPAAYFGQEFVKLTSAGEGMEMIRTLRSSLPATHVQYLKI